MRTVWAAGAAAVGLVAGGLGGLALQPDPKPPSLGAALARISEEVPLPGGDGAALLVWTSGGLPPGLGERIAALPDVTSVTAVVGGVLDLRASYDADGRTVDEAPADSAIPLDAIAVDTRGYTPFVPAGLRTVFAELSPGQALLGATSARLRRLGTSGTIELAGGRRLTVVGVVPDAVVGAAEVVVTRDTANSVGTERYLLVGYRGERVSVEAAVRRTVGEGTAVRIRGSGETPFLREGDAVLPQALIKERFGEFPYRRAAGTDIEIMGGWPKDNIVTADVPLIGTVTCHRALIAALRGAMRELEGRNLGFLVDSTSYGGCWVPGLIPPGPALSRHSWGAALDLNVRKNPTGVASTQDARLVEVMARWGFTSGASWLVPDAAHFEYLRPPL